MATILLKEALPLRMGAFRDGWTKASAAHFKEYAKHGDTYGVRVPDRDAAKAWAFVRELDGPYAVVDLRCKQPIAFFSEWWLIVADNGYVYKTWRPWRVREFLMWTARGTTGDIGDAFACFAGGTTYRFERVEPEDERLNQAKIMVCEGMWEHDTTNDWIEYEEGD